MTWQIVNIVAAVVNVVTLAFNLRVFVRWRREDGKLSPQDKRERALWTAGFNEGRVAERRSRRISW